MGSGRGWRRMRVGERRQGWVQVEQETWCIRSCRWLVGVPWDDQRGKEGPNPSRGQLMAHVDVDKGTGTRGRGRYTHAKYPKVKEWLSCGSSLGPQLPPCMAAAHAKRVLTTVGFGLQGRHI